MSIVNRNNTNSGKKAHLRSRNVGRDDSEMMTASQFVETSAVAQSVLNGWELHWGITDGGLSIDEGARALEVIAGMSDDYEELLKLDEQLPKMCGNRNGCATKNEWYVCLEIAERLKLTPVYRGTDERSYMQRTDYRYLDDEDENSLSDKH